MEAEVERLLTQVKVKGLVVYTAGMETFQQDEHCLAAGREHASCLRGPVGAGAGARRRDRWQETGRGGKCFSWLEKEGLALLRLELRPAVW